MTRAIDMFAGWGGFTEGANLAGVDVVWAANHWDLAVQAHRLNHPRTHHVCQDLRQADWSQLPDYDLLLASPACQGSSQAAQPSRARSERVRRHHDALRCTAWAVFDCAWSTRPKALVIENVPDMQKWAFKPVDDPGHVRGDAYQYWLEGLRKMGYNIREYVIPATAFGVPQKRNRLFIVGHLGPEINLEIPTVDKEPAFGPCVEWDAGEWRDINSARGGPARRRLRIASHTYGRALVQHVSHHKGLPLSEPIRTITTQDQWALVDGYRYRSLTVRETARGMGFGDHYTWPESANRKANITGLGNAVCPPVAQGIIEQVKEVIA